MSVRIVRLDPLMLRVVRTRSPFANVFVLCRRIEPTCHPELVSESQMLKRVQHDALRFGLEQCEELCNNQLLTRQ